MKSMPTVPTVTGGLLILLFAAVGIPVSAASSQPKPPPLFTPLDAPAAPAPTAPGVVRERAVRVDFDLLDRMADAWTQGRQRSSARIRLNLFPGISAVTTPEEIRSETASSLSWVGRLVGQPDGAVTLVWGGGVLVGHVRIQEAVFRIQYAADGVHRVQELDPTAFPEEDEPIEIPLPALASGAEPEVGSLADSGSTIDVLVVYTGAARAAAGGTTAIQNEIAAAITDTNTAYANSSIIPRVRLVHSAELNYSETGSSGTELDRLRGTSDGYMDTVHALRDIYRADIVALLVANMTDACGRGYLMSGNNPGFAPFAFSVTDRDCLFQYTMTHEMGHNMGCNHAPQDPTGSGAFSYSFGYKDATHGFRTVMAYDCPGCPRVRHFSNPGVNYNGWTTGTSTQNNARSINNVRTTVANWRDSTAACTAGSQKLCFQSNRFEANVTWRNPSNGQEGIGNSITYSNEGGFFWFFGSSNVETGVKVLDGRSVNGKFWVFHGSLTTTEYVLRIRDTATGSVKTYTKASGSLCGTGDISAFSGSPEGPILVESGLSFEGEPASIGTIGATGTCTSLANSVCLLNNRFQVRVKKGGAYQNGTAVTGQSGVFWFGSQSNPEVIVKVLDGTGINGKYWVFYGSLTSLSYQVEVTDTVTAVTNIYTPPAAFCGQADTTAF